MSAGMSEVVLVDQGLLSAYGSGVARCADGLLAGLCAFRPADGFGLSAALEKLPVGAVPPGETPVSSDSRFFALLDAVLPGMQAVPRDAAVYVATTAGAITEMEESVRTGAGPTVRERLSLIPLHVASRLGLENGAMQVVSSACASSTAALALAASAIRRGEIECALVAGCDLVSEFVLSGFSALMAIDSEGARPFDGNRRGVTLGEASAFALLMRRDRAERENRKCLGFVGGWAMTCDANHLTGPSRDGAPLADAIRSALEMADCPPGKVGAICAHGTGTLYNDTMEMLAFKQVFGGLPIPTFSVKGGMGHTLGAAGLAEALLSLEFLRRGRVPPTVGLSRVSEEADGWASGVARSLDDSSAVLTTNSGFGGTNAALVLSLGSLSAPAARPAGISLRQTGEGRAMAEEAPASPDAAPAMPRNFGRFSAEARRAFRAVARALDAAGFREAGNTLRFSDGARPARVGIVAHDPEGSERANRAYFSDYIQSGRVLGRGQLFVYTLPTSVAAECAIACHLTGPLLYVADSGDGVYGAERAARGWLADGLADAVVALSSTSEEARATVWVAERIQEKELP
jgi:3-oxoacyl-[acyl-carrier-protein] synthase II